MLIIDGGYAAPTVLESQVVNDAAVLFSQSPPEPLSGAGGLSVHPAAVPAAWRAVAPVWSRFPAWVTRFGLCVAHHESWYAPPSMWRAHNPTSSASAFAQWTDGTWQANVRRAHQRFTRRALYAPPAEQVAVFGWMVTHGHIHAWNGTHCGYGT